MKPQKTVILTDSKAALQSLTSNTPDQSVATNCWKICSFSHMNAPWSYSGSGPTVGFHEMKEQITWPNLRASNCNPCQPPLTWKPKPCSESKKCQWKRATDPINHLTRHEQTIIFRLRTGQWPVSTPEVYWHHGVCTLRLQRSRTDHPPHPPGPFLSGSNRDISYGRRMSQPPTSCGEQRKTCATPTNSWQHVDWGCKHGWSTAEEAAIKGTNHDTHSLLGVLCSLIRYYIHNVLYS